MNENVSDTQHTPTPWRGHYNEWNQLLAIVHGNGRTIIHPHMEADPDTGTVRVRLTSCNYDSEYLERHDADMQFLFRAVNCHDQLLAACKHLMAEIMKLPERQRDFFCDLTLNAGIEAAIAEDNGLRTQ